MLHLRPASPHASRNSCGGAARHEEHAACGYVPRSFRACRPKLPGRDARPSSPEPVTPEAAWFLLLVCFRYRLPNFPHSPAGCGRERQRLGVLPDGFQASSLLCLIQFVDLGCDDHIWMVIGLEPRFQIEVLIHPATARVQDQE